MIQERQQQAAERIMEDAGLTGDLTDDQARPLIDWATNQATRIAGDAARSDAEVDVAIGAIRRTILQVASVATRDHTEGQLVALAQQTLLQLAPDLGLATIDPADSTCTLSTEALATRGPTRRTLWQQRRRWKLGRLFVRRRRPR